MIGWYASTNWTCNNETKKAIYEKRFILYSDGGVLRTVLLVVCEGRVGGEGWGDGRAPVRLALSLSGNSSRTVDAPTADGNWDFTTPEQGTIVEGDVYVLVIDAVTQRLKYLVEDLRVINDYADQKILEGTMQRTIGNEQVRLVVLANLNQNQIQGVSEGMQAYLNTMVAILPLKSIINWFIITLVRPRGICRKASADVGDQSRYRCPSCRTKLRVQTV